MLKIHQVNFFKSIKKNKANQVRRKAACDSEEHVNILCKITAENVEHSIPVLYINILKALKNLVWVTWF